MSLRTRKYDTELKLIMVDHVTGAIQAVTSAVLLHQGLDIEVVTTDEDAQTY
jgi:hypothetical protein